MAIISQVLDHSDWLTNPLRFNAFACFLWVSESENSAYFGRFAQICSRCPHNPETVRQRYLEGSGCDEESQIVDQPWPRPQPAGPAAALLDELFAHPAL